MITADTITDEQIRELRAAIVTESESGRVDAGTWPLVSACTVALWVPLSISDDMFLLHPYRSHAQEGQRMRREARARCAEILAARAKESR